MAVQTDWRKGRLSPTAFPTLEELAAGLTDIGFGGGSPAPTPSSDFLDLYPGMQVATFDPGQGAGAASCTLASGIITLIRVKTAGQTVSELGLVVSGMVNDPTAGANWVGVYAEDGDRLAQAAIDDFFVQGAVDVHEVNFGASFDLPPGFARIAILHNSNSAEDAGVGGSYFGAPPGLMQLPNPAGSNPALWRLAKIGDGSLRALPSTLDFNQNQADDSQAFPFIYLY